MLNKSEDIFKAGVDRMTTTKEKKRRCNKNPLTFGVDFVLKIDSV